PNHTAVPALFPLRPPTLPTNRIPPTSNAGIGPAGHPATPPTGAANSPASSKPGPAAEVVCLNLMPGVVTCAQVLEAVVSAVPVDVVNTMMYTADDPYALEKDPPVWDAYRAVLRAAGLKLDLEPIAKWDFYKAGETPDHVL